MTHKSDYGRLIGELSQSTVTAGNSDRIERRKREIKKAYQGIQREKNILLPYNIQRMPDIYGINYNGIKPRPTFLWS